jgi:hypothetical protein
VRRTALQLINRDDGKAHRPHLPEASNGRESSGSPHIQDRPRDIKLMIATNNAEPMIDQMIGKLVVPI